VKTEYNNSMTRFDETWHRLREWTSQQAPSERLAAQILHHEGFEDIDPSHPLGGKDGGRDGVCTRNGRPWVFGVYFPRGQETFADIKKKFAGDLKGARKHDPHGFAFVTNQELRLAERKELQDLGETVEIELYHLERIAMILDFPEMAQIRKQFLDIDPSAIPISVDLEIVGEVGYFLRGDELREKYIQNEAAEARNKQTQPAKPLPAYAAALGLHSSPPPTAEQIEARIERWSTQLRDNWEKHEDHLASTAWPGLEFKVHNTGEVFLNDVRIVITIDGVRGLKWKDPGQFEFYELCPPLYPTQKGPLGDIWVPEPLRPHHPVKWKNLAHAVEITIDLQHLRPHPEGSPSPEWSGDHDLVLVLLNQDDPAATVTAEWVVTAQTYGKAYKGQPCTIPTRAIDIGKSLSAVVPANQ